MVFSGIPSSACLSCRKRRIKCDKCPSGCKQCSRKNIPCTGYRDLSTIRILDETEKVSSKMKRIHKIAGDPVCKDSNGQGASPSLILRCQPVDSIQDLSINYFFRLYIGSTAFETYLEDLYKTNPAGNDDACSLAMKATAYTTFMQHTRQGSVETARKLYLEAMSKLRFALSNDELASDRTLATVLLLAEYEAADFQPGQSLTSWISHVSGLLALLRQRGTLCFDSNTSMQLFLHASRNIRASYIQQNLELPSDYLDLSAKASHLLSDSDPALNLLPFVKMVGDLRAQLHRHPRYDLLLQAMDITQKIDRFSKETISSCAPYSDDKAQASRHPWAYQGHAHRYKSLVVAKMWNVLQLLKIYLGDLVADGSTGIYVVKLDPSESEVSNSRFDMECLPRLHIWGVKTVNTTSTEILAGIPSFLDKEDGKYTFSLPARSLVWPLCTIVRCSSTPALARARASKCLDKLAIDLDFGEKIERGRIIRSDPSWLHLYS